MKQNNQMSLLAVSAGPARQSVADVTVIIVNYDSLTCLKRCLGQLQLQTFRPAHTLVIDNSDGGDCCDLATEFPDIEIVMTSRNIGFSAANNLGFAKCRTSLTALLNPDAFPESDWLANIVAAASRNPQAACFGSVQLSDDSTGIIDGLGDSYSTGGVFKREGHGKSVRGLGGIQARQIFSPCAAAALYRRDAILNAGGFDEDFFCYGEDVDLGFRLRLAGWISMLVPGAVVRHVGSASSGGPRSEFASYHGHRNMVWVYVKNMPGFLFWLFLPLHIFANCVSVIVLTIRGQGKVAWRAKRDAIKGLPAMWKKRQAIQSQRVASLQDIWRALSFRWI